MVPKQNYVIFESKINKLKTIDDLLNHYDTYYKMDSFAEALNNILSQKKTTKQEIVQRTQIGRTYVYQIFSGKRRPSRNKLLQITVALHCCLEETQNLLILSNHAPLNLKNKRDIIISFAIYRYYTLFDLNEILDNYGELPLFNEQ